jgi:cobalt-zinc-cadmium efflux system outer membrane protein
VSTRHAGHSVGPGTFTLVLTLALAGCAGIPADRGLDAVDRTLAARGVAAAPTATALAGFPAPAPAMLAAPLTLDDAQRLALAHNPTLLAQFAALGIVQADAYDAARLANPRFSLAWLDAAGGGEQVTLGLAQNIADLLTLSPRRRIAEGEVGRAQQQAGAALLALAADVEAAYYRHVTALAERDLRRAIAEAGGVSADFAAALHTAGNINQLALDRERAAAETLAVDAVRIEFEVAATRAALAQLMGVDADLQWTVAGGLPLPVAQEDELAALQRIAAAGRLDLLAAQRAVVLLEDALGLARSFRWLGSFEVGIEHEDEPDGGELTGPTFAFELPLFNQGAGRVTRAAAQLDGARAAARRTALAAGNEVARAWAGVAAAREIVERYRDRLVPLRERIVDGARQMQNYMLIGQFEVLEDKRAQYAAYGEYLAALGDYWQARAALSRATGAPLPSAASTSPVAVTPDRLLAEPLPAPAGHSHRVH